MALSITNKRTLVIMIIGVLLFGGVYAFVGATTSHALPAYAAATGQACGVCHVNPAGGGERTAKGQAFAAIPTHGSDPAGAWAQINAPAPVATPAAAPVATSPINLVISGASTGDSVVYSIMVRNTTKQPVTNLYVSGGIPNGSIFTSATNTPSGSNFFSASDGSAAWLVNSVPASGAAGPFVYKVAIGSATDLSVLAFAHWVQPSEGTTTSPIVTPISNAERVAIDEAINDKLNTIDNSLLLWSFVPGNGPRMVDLARDINLAWFAGQAKNWVMADYEMNDQLPSDLNKLKQRNATIAPSLTNFNDTTVKPVVDAIKAKDLNAFTAAYDTMLAGCNSCHAGREDSKSIKIIRPTAPIIPELDFNGN